MAEEDKRVKGEALQKALANQFKVNNENVEVLKWTVGSGHGPAESFACDLVAVTGTAKVKLKDGGQPEVHRFSLMAKLAPAGEHRSKMIHEVSFCWCCDVFKLEIQAFQARNSRF